MKAMLALIILFGSANSFAQGTEIRANAQWKYEMAKAKKVFCDKNAEYCAVKKDIENLTQLRTQTSKSLSLAHYQANLACEYKTVRYVQRMSKDEVVKHVNYTPCDQTPEYNQNVKPLREKAAKIALKLRAVDAALAEKNAELAELAKEIK